MPHRIAAGPVATAVALVLLPAAAPAQDNPRTVGVSVDGIVVEVPADVAAQACGVDAETLLAQWEGLGTELQTMADTTVAADATDLAPEVAGDTQMDSVLDGQTVADGADATHEADGEAATDLASDVSAGAAGGAADAAGAAATPTASTQDTEPGAEPAVPADGSMDAGVEAAAGAAGDDPATADAATTEEVAAAGTGQGATDGPGTPTEGTLLSKAAVCEVSRETADGLGIALPG